MIERMLIALALIALLIAGLAAARALLRHRDRRLVSRLRGREEEGPAPPRVVYFTTSSCVVCRAQQEPALAALERELPELVLERHDAVAEQALAKQYGVITVPTTAVYDRDGQLVTINRGFTPAAVLHSQIEGAEPVLESGAAMASERVE